MPCGGGDRQESTKCVDQLLRGQVGSCVLGYITFWGSLALMDMCWGSLVGGSRGESAVGATACLSLLPGSFPP